MVTSLNNAKPAHDFQYQAVNYIRGTITALASGATVTAAIGRLPPGAVICGISNRVSTAFSGGTPLLTLGDSTDAGNDNITATLAEASASELVQPLATFAMPLTAEVEVWANLSGGATAGSATISVLYTNS
jgi:hypothetical protein